MAIFAEEVVEDVQGMAGTISEARKVDPEADLGDMVVVDTTLKISGGVAALEATPVIQQRIKSRSVDSAATILSSRWVRSSVVWCRRSARGAAIGLDKRLKAACCCKDMILRERL